MHVMISYDIQSDRRRTKLHKVLKNYGEWMQYSVFECQVSEKEYQELRERLLPLVDVAAGDTLRLYRICGECQPKIEHLGGQTARPDGAVIL